jgi:hypothetical protein
MKERIFTLMAACALLLTLAQPALRFTPARLAIWVGIPNPECQSGTTCD